MVADMSQATTLPPGPTRFAAWMVWLPAPQARSRTRMSGRMPAISMSVSVAGESPAENSRSHFAQPGAAFSQVLRSSDFAESEIMVATLPSREGLYPTTYEVQALKRCRKRALAGIVVPSGMSALGQKPDIDPLPSHVRFTPKSGHWNSGLECLLCAKS